MNDLNGDMPQKLLLAGMAMQGILSGVCSNIEMFNQIRDTARNKKISIAQHVAKMSLEQSDMLIKQFYEHNKNTQG